MSVDLHNHTILCNHASGTTKEYIQKAIEKKIKYFGFSDHAPMNFDTKYRMNFSKMSEYEKEILHAKDLYKDKINILLGYEVDFLKGYIDKSVLKANVDYLIGSVHFINKWSFDNPEFIGEYKNKDIDKIWQEYFEAVEDLAKSGLFQIVGHIDLIKIFNFFPKKDVKLIAKNAIKAIKKSGMAIEINSAGYRKPIGEAYPSRALLEMAYERDIPITFGSDAHKPEQVGYKKDEIKWVAKSVGYCNAIYFKNREMIMLNF